MILKCPSHLRFYPLSIAWLEFSGFMVLFSFLWPSRKLSAVQKQNVFVLFSRIRSLKRTLIVYLTQSLLSSTFFKVFKSFFKSDFSDRRHSDDLFIISQCFLFVKHFLKFFEKHFLTEWFAVPHCDSSIIIRRL